MRALGQEYLSHHPAAGTRTTISVTTSIPLATNPSTHLKAVMCLAQERSDLTDINYATDTSHPVQLQLI